MLRRLSTKWLLWLLVGSVVQPVAGEDILLTGQTMGTSYRILVPAGIQLDAPTLQSLVDQRLAEIDQRMSTYRDDSDVTRFNQANASVWVPVHPETARVVNLALEISNETDGAFDCTVGPLVNLWNFGPHPQADFHPPDSDQLERALARVGYEKVIVRLTESPLQAALQKTVDGVSIDLSAIAKGFAVDAIRTLLQDQGVSASMVEIGGEVDVRGTNKGQPWRIGIESPQPDRRRIDAVVALQDEAMASSGDYRNYFRHRGKTYSHTIDPRTGWPVASSLSAVTVVANSCARADALATAMMVMGDRAFAWAEERNVKALCLNREQAQITRKATSLFPAFQSSRDSAGTSFPILVLAAIVVFGLAILGMSLGTIIANKRLQGSCGGMAGLRDEQGRTMCDLCTKPSPECSGPPVAQDDMAPSSCGENGLPHPEDQSS